ncbi:MAG: hypothetical protein B7C54_02230 [Acidimicrobiales bacterium mtb01]|nr:hypothetical protein [Actinomycetota bacterium]TEX47901.1 MAG: hypothetical protein B7C54_02230 [Acidimicrobiales bacterium mtb01]
MWRKFVVASALLVGCAPSPGGEVSTDDFDALLRMRTPPSIDRWEVALCRVPSGVEAGLFAPLAERLAIDAAEIVDRLGPVSDYFARWSQGSYSLEWRAAPPVDLDSSGDPMSCVDRALDASDDDTTGVLVVADAQHDSDQIGGWGRPGSDCEQPCAARTSRRAVYVGASDFMPQWEDDSPLDLLQHELGHALDWPHSATAAGFADTAADEHGVYDSPFDVMSDSVAPRAIDSRRRGAPGILAVNLHSVGWLDRSGIEFVDPDRHPEGEWHDATRLVSTDSVGDDDAKRLMVVQVGDGRFLTVELVAARSDNDHVRSSGVLIHLVEPTENNEGRRNVLLTEAIIGEERTWTWNDGRLEFAVGIIAAEGDRVTTDVRFRRLGAERVARSDG